MDRLRLLAREPALLIDAFESAVVLAVALGLFHLTGESQRDLIALFIAVLAVVKGFTTHPFPVTVVPDLGRAALVFFGSVQLTHLTADQITLVATFLGTLMVLLQRAQITPANDAIIRPGGAGAGPVATRTEAGALNSRASLGIAVMLVGVLVAYLIHWVLGIIIVVVGLVLLLT
jgi:hypothetical protein